VLALDQLCLAVIKQDYQKEHDVGSIDLL
jgi:hypothetical protein